MGHMMFGLFTRKPEWTGVRHDYREKQLRWGHSIVFKRQRGKYRGHMWCGRGVRRGDRVNLGATDKDLLVVGVEGCTDPADMYFFTAVETPIGGDEPDQIYPFSPRLRAL